jgi:homoserine dehydrogenase
LKIALLGCGTVGTEIALRLIEGRGQLVPLIGEDLELVSIYVSDLTKPRDPRIPKNLFSTDLEKVLDSGRITTAIEVMGGVESTYLIQKNILQAGINLITANKAVLSSYLVELSSIAKKHNSLFYYEAAVGGAVPMVLNIQNYLTGNALSIEGVLNGTTNYILNEMSMGVTYEAALGEAQRLGYAEKDPTADVSGVDTAQKLAILTNIAFGGQIKGESILRVGIDNLPPLIGVFAHRTGRVIRLIGKAQKHGNTVKAFVTPALVNKEHPLALVGGSDNKILIESDFFGNLILGGPGAGGRETAAAVISDLIRVAQTPKNMYFVDFNKDFEVESDFMGDFYIVARLNPDREISALPGEVTYMRKTMNYLEWVTSSTSRSIVVEQLESMTKSEQFPYCYSPVPIF